MARVVKRDNKGHKLWQKGSEDRTTDYRKWRLEGVGQQPELGFAHDVDQFEWRFFDDVPKIVSILELTRSDGPIYSDVYLSEIWKRYFKTERQGERIIEISTGLNCLAFIVAFTPDLDEFYVNDILKKKDEWKKYSKQDYTRFLCALKEWWIKRCDPKSWHLRDIPFK